MNILKKLESEPILEFVIGLALPIVGVVVLAAAPLPLNQEIDITISLCICFGWLALHSFYRGIQNGELIRVSQLFHSPDMGDEETRDALEVLLALNVIALSILTLVWVLAKMGVPLEM